MITKQNKIKNKDKETLKAGCVVVNENKEILLVSNKEGKIWAFPKGHVESGEGLENVALREVKEETGYEVKILKKLSDITYANGQELIRVAMFKAKPIERSGEGEKNMKSGWFSLEEAKKNIYKNLVPFLNELK